MEMHVTLGAPTAVFHHKEDGCGGQSLCPGETRFACFSKPLQNVDQCRLSFSLSPLLQLLQAAVTIPPL